MIAILKKRVARKRKSKFNKRNKYPKSKIFALARDNRVKSENETNEEEDSDEDEEDDEEDEELEDDDNDAIDSSESDEYNDRILTNIHNLNNLVNSLSQSLNQLEMNENEENDDNLEDIHRNPHRNRQIRRLMRFAWPLIVINPGLLETSYLQLKEILDTSESQSTNWTDEDLVKLLIRNDYDLNRVIPIVLNIE